MHKSSAHVRIVGASESCKQNESPLHWPAQAAASSGAARGVPLFESDGTFTVPAGVTSVVVELWGGGGASGLAPGAGGGGGGGYVRTVVAVTPGQGVPVTIGQGGTPACGMDGGAGGDTLFGGLAMAGGGGGGTIAGQGGAGGTANAGGISYPGEAGGAPGSSGTGRSSQGTFAPYRSGLGVAAPGKGGIPTITIAIPSCIDPALQFATGQAGQAIVQW